MQFEYISPEWEEEEMYWIWNKCFGEVAPHLILLPESNIARQHWVQTPWQWPIKVATDSYPRSLAFQIGNIYGASVTMTTGCFLYSLE